MFICEKCAKKNGVDTFWFMIKMLSRGPCEICKKISSCLDIHYIQFPEKENKKETR